MKKLLVIFTLMLTFLSVRAQEVTISGNHFLVNGKPIWFNGINTPWDLFDDFGRSDFDVTWWENEFQRYVDNHINLARVWIHGSGEVSPTITSDGTVTGANDLFWQQMDELMTIAHAKHVYVMPCLFSFDIVKNTYTTYTQWRAFVSDSSKVRTYINNVLIPLVKRYNNEPYLLGWEICNEPEWMFENAEDGPMLKSDVQRLHAMCAAAIHENSTKPVTTGSSCVKWNSPLYAGTGDNAGNVWSDSALQSVYNNPNAYLDFWQIHWYPWMSEWFSSPYQQTTAYYQINDKPVIVGETEGNDVCDTYICMSLVDMYENAYTNGYAGVCGWKTPQNDGAGTFANIAVATNAFYSNHGALVYPIGPPVAVTGVTVSESSISLPAGDTLRLSASVLPTDASDQRVTWSSANSSVASVTSTGLVAGVTTGTTTITATSLDGDFTASCSVTITPGNNTNSPCGTPVAVALPLVQNGVGEFCWVTSGDISNVNSWNMDSVVVNGVNMTNVYANTMPARINGNYYIHYVASVSWAHLEVNGTGGSNGGSVAVTGVSISPTSDTVNVGSTTSLTATIAPSDASDQVVSWSSSNPGVATVSSNGVVTGVASGSATITVTTDDGGYTASSDITVSQTNTPVTGVSVSPTTVTIQGSTTTSLTATVTPSNATDQSVSWSTSDASVATVSSSGVVTGVAQGNATITVTTTDGGYTATSAITVTPIDVVVTGVTIAPTSDTITVGGTTTLAANVLPSNATVQSVTWSTSDANVATVGASGVVTGIGVGNATITVTTTDGGYTASSTITVISGGGTPCANPVTISIPFSQDGVGNFCWVTSQSIAYINSWNMDLLEINGVDYTNVWSNSLPAPINGNYYIHYVGSVDWAHFEAPATKSAKSLTGDLNDHVKVYPIPFKNELTIDLNGLKNVKSIQLLNTLGQVVQTLDGSQINSRVIKLHVDQSGNLFILKIESSDGIISKAVVKN